MDNKIVTVKAMREDMGFIPSYFNFASWFAAISWATKNSASTGLKKIEESRNHFVFESNGWKYVMTETKVYTYDDVSRRFSLKED